MTPQRSRIWPAATLGVGAILLLIALPNSLKQWTPEILRRPAMHFGLDLVGGTQLDFRISEQEMETQLQKLRAEKEQAETAGATAETINTLQFQISSIEEQKRSIVEAIRNVLERRINALGVSEAVITPSYVGNEKHLLVDCPGVVDTQACIATVGKTIQLEFKEEFTEPTAEFETEVRRKADAAMRRLTASGESLKVVGEDLGDDLGMAFQDTRLFFESELPKGLQDLWAGQQGVVRREGSITVPVQEDDGTTTQKEIPGIFLAEVTGPKTMTGRIVADASRAFAILAQREPGSTVQRHDARPFNEIPADVGQAIRGISQGQLTTASTGSGTAHVIFLRRFDQGQEQMEASHILIAYKGASQAEPDITRTKEEALALAQDVKTRLEKGEKFSDLARLSSDGGSAARGGSLGTFGRGKMVPTFESAAFALKEGEISDPVETPFGYHIIRSDKAPSRSPDRASYEELILTGPEASARAEQLKKDLEAGRVTETAEAIPLRWLFFSLMPTGWKDTPLDGKHFRSAAVTLDPVSNLPVVQIIFDDEGGKIFQELTKRNVGKRIAIFVGGELVSAPVVQGEIAGGSAVITGSANFDEARTLAQDLNTGAIPAPIYLAGQYSVEATLGAEALQTSLRAAIWGIIVLMLYMIIIYRLLGFLADLALLVYGLIFVVILKLPLFLFSHDSIVLTVAGMAGIILSIGMAVDANVLIFERIKEELRKGKLLRTAVDVGFQRAWPSIRDGNASTLITCLILFLIGSSIVRGFAITLGMGVLLSMFSAIVVTRQLIRFVAKTPLAERRDLFGDRRKEVVA